MFNVVFDPWVITPDEAVITWAVHTLDNVTLDRVEYRVWRSDATPELLVTATAGLTVALDVSNFTGTLYAEVKAIDTLNNVVTRLSEFQVANRVLPTAPDWISEAWSGGDLVLNWGAALVSASTTNWKVYHRDAAGAITLMGFFPSAQFSSTFTVNRAALHSLFIVGLDAYARESVPSPLVSFAVFSPGPDINVSSWVIGPQNAAVGFTVSDGATVEWELWVDDTLAMTGYDPTTAHWPIVNFQGTLTLKVTAQDEVGTRVVTSIARVWNRVPRQPRIVVQAVGHDYLRLEISPDADDPVTVAMVELSGLGMVIRKPSPLVYTFTNLAPDTEYAFVARAVNPAGYTGAATDTTTVRTFQDLSDSEASPDTLVPGPVLGQIVPWLSGDLLEWFLQFSTDTRVREPLTSQIHTRPDILDQFLDMIEPIADNLGQIIRDETTDQFSYEASTLIDKTPDPLFKLVVLCERLTYGKLLNRG